MAAWCPAKNSQEPGLDSITENVEYTDKEGLNTRLPVDAHKEQILNHIDNYRVTCIQGDTGSGKSTRVPQYIVEQYLQQRDSWDHEEPRIVVTQPRRIAAKQLAHRVAKEMGEKVVGGKVGYKIGQEHEAGPETLICYVTAGYLIELLVHNPEVFNTYTHVILDEIHERDLDADLLSLVVNLLMDKFEKPKLIIMSATLQVELFLEYFSDQGRQIIQGPNHPIDRRQLLTVSTQSQYNIDTHYIEGLYGYCMANGTPVSNDLKQLLVRTYCYFCKITPQELLAGQSAQPIDSTMQQLAHEIDVSNLKKDDRPRVKVEPIDDYIRLGLLIVQATAIPTGSILIFLPGVSEIEKMYELLLPFEEKLHDDWNSHITLFTLHSKMPFEDQSECFRVPEDTCHVILATNMAESSVTLPRVGVVIDFGQRRHLVYNHGKRMSVLMLSWCSQASMNQRKGRTGRVCEGLCFRVMTEDHFDHQREFDPAQMQLAPLDKLVLQVKYVGDEICPDESPSDLLAQAIEPPDTQSIDSAVKNLADIGALSSNNESSEVTLLGKFSMHVPLDLYLCRLVFFGMMFNCPCDAIVMAAALQSQDPFKQPSNKVFKNTQKFVKCQKGSFEARKKYDDLTYSEPIMYRNVVRHWCQEVLGEEERRQEVGHVAGKGKKDIKTFRRRFGRENEVDDKRLQLLEGVIDDVAKATAKWYEPNSAERAQVDTLLKLLPRNRARFGEVGPGGDVWQTMDEETDELQTLFSDNHMLLYTVLAGTFVPRFLYGEVKPSGDNFDKLLGKADMDPRNSIILTKIPKDISGNEEMIRKVIRDVSLCSSSEESTSARSTLDEFIYKVQGDQLLVEFISEDRFAPTSESYKQRKVTDESHHCVQAAFQFTENPGDQLLVEFISEDRFAPTSESYKQRKVTDESHHCVQAAFQFTENPGGHEKQKVFIYMPSPDDRRRYGLKGNKMKIGMVQSPYRLEWKLLSQDGTALMIGGESCRAAYERWRNPGGFICDVYKRKHFGVGYNPTANERGTRCWVQGITLLPTYKQNLFAMALMLMFLPKQHGVRFKVGTDKMAISQVHLFEQKLDIYRANPLTEKLIKVINRVRRLTSDIFGNKNALKTNRFPPANLDDRFDELMLNLQVGDISLDKRANKTDTSDDGSIRSLRTHEIVDGFYQSPDSQIVYERQDLSRNVYLEPYNTDVLFRRDCLEEYVQSVGQTDDDYDAELLELLESLAGIKVPD